MAKQERVRNLHRCCARLCLIILLPRWDGREASLRVRSVWLFLYADRLRSSSERFAASEANTCATRRTCFFFLLCRRRWLAVVRVCRRYTWMPSREEEGVSTEPAGVEEPVLGCVVCARHVRPASSVASFLASWFSCSIGGIALWWYCLARAA